jgi:hypothetical protein
MVLHYRTGLNTVVTGISYFIGGYSQGLVLIIVILSLNQEVEWQFWIRVSAIPVATLGPTQQQQQTVAGVQVKHADGVQRFSVPAGFAQLVQTSTGRHILLTPSSQVIQPLSQNPGTTTGKWNMSFSEERLFEVKIIQNKEDSFTIHTYVRMYIHTCYICKSSLK